MIDTAEACTRVMGLLRINDQTAALGYIAAARRQCPNVSYTYEVVWGALAWGCLEHRQPQEEMALFVRHWEEVCRRYGVATGPKLVEEKAEGCMADTPPHPHDENPVDNVGENA